MSFSPFQIITNIGPVITFQSSFRGTCSTFILHLLCAPRSPFQPQSTCCFSHPCCRCPNNQRKETLTRDCATAGVYSGPAGQSDEPQTTSCSGRCCIRGKQEKEKAKPATAKDCVHFSTGTSNRGRSSVTVQRLPTTSHT